MYNQQTFFTDTEIYPYKHLGDKIIISSSANGFGELLNSDCRAVKA